MNSQQVEELRIKVECASAVQVHDALSGLTLGFIKNKDKETVKVFENYKLVDTIPAKELFHTVSTAVFMMPIVELLIDSEPIEARESLA